MLKFEPTLKFEMDATADAAYVRISDEPVQATHEISRQRVLDYDARGDVVGIEFLGVSHGVSLRDLPRLPHRDRLARLFDEHHITLVD